MLTLNRSLTGPFLAVLTRAFHVSDPLGKGKIGAASLSEESDYLFLRNEKRWQLFPIFA